MVYLWFHFIFGFGYLSCHFSTKNGFAVCATSNQNRFQQCHFFSKNACHYIFSIHKMAMVQSILQKPILDFFWVKSNIGLALTKALIEQNGQTRVHWIDSLTWSWFGMHENVQRILIEGEEAPKLDFESIFLIRQLLRFEKTSSSTLTDACLSYF